MLVIIGNNTIRISRLFVKCRIGYFSLFPRFWFESYKNGFVFIIKIGWLRSIHLYICEHLFL
jgi:hypothetical protein